jgi:hypothetical protein
MGIFLYTMKGTLLSIGFFGICLLACKIKESCYMPAPKQATDAKSDTAPHQTLPKTNGVVSHRYSSTGCSPVIITDKVTPKGDTIILIPVGGLGEFDVDGLKISFNYRRSMIKNPQGCTNGSPAILSNINKR